MMMQDEDLEDEIKTMDESADFHADCRDLLHWLVHALSLSLSPFFLFPLSQPPKKYTE